MSVPEPHDDRGEPEDEQNGQNAPDEQNGQDALDEHGWDELDDDWDEPSATRWSLDWHSLYPRERWAWFERLWTDACELQERYRLSIRAGWWEDAVQVEALAALAAWVARYDSGEWDDPPGKLALLHDLEHVSVLLRDGREPFWPARDRIAFTLYLVDIGCQPPPGEQ